MNEGYTSEHVLQNLKLPKVPINLIEPLTSNEIEQLLSCQNQLTALGCRNIATLVALLDTGLRLSELCGLRYEGAHIDEGYLKVMGKGSKDRMVPPFVGECMTDSSLYNLKWSTFDFF